MAVKDDSFGIACLQDKMLDILKYFIAFCQKNHLRYWAGGGTCLGALRHEGFIPWDDDLDVFMPRSDYELFWKLWNEDRNNNGKYQLCRTTEEKNYHHRVMQIVDTSTTFINRRSVDEDIEHGVYIDIIPMDMCAKGKMNRALQIYHAIVFSIYNVQCIPEFQGGKLMRFGTALLLQIVKDKRKRTDIWKKAERKMISEDQSKANNVVELTTSFKSLLRPWPSEWFGERTQKFEDIELSIPSQAEKYMTAIYGDYMKLPPTEEQKVRHNTVFIDLEHSYRDYKGKYYCVRRNP